MVRLISIIFALVVATSAQAMSLAPLHQPDNLITQIREACGAGMHMVNGTCIVCCRPPKCRKMCSWNAHSGWPLR